jgi:hypothetical protein
MMCGTLIERLSRWRRGRVHRMLSAARPTPEVADVTENVRKIRYSNGASPDRCTVCPKKFCDDLEIPMNYPVSLSVPE